MLRITKTEKVLLLLVVILSLSLIIYNVYFVPMNVEPLPVTYLQAEEFQEPVPEVVLVSEEETKEVPQIVKEVSRGSEEYRDTVNRSTYYLGEWTVTHYSHEECGKSTGAMGKQIVPWKTIAIDPKHHRLGDRYFMEGVGEVTANDTGGNIKGPQRADLCVEDRETCRKEGVKKRKVWKL